MKVFVFNNQNDEFDFPKDMEKILSYLEDVGHINNNVSKKDIEKYYRDFCNDYYCAEWLGITDNLLEDFSEYLSKRDVD